MTLKLEQTEIAGKKGKWSLEIPIDMKAAFHSPLGMEIELEKIEFSPSATRLMLETTLAKSAYVEVEREMEEVTLEGERAKITEKYKNPVLSGTIFRSKFQTKKVML